MKIKLMLLTTVLLPVIAIAQDKCRSHEKPLRDNLQKIFQDIKDQKPIKNREGKMVVPKSVDDFLSVLPKELTTDPIFMSSSQSLQGATVENPRVLLKSPNSEITLSFTTDPKLSGGDHVEVIVFNPEEAKYDVFEVDFSETERKKQAPKVDQKDEMSKLLEDPAPKAHVNQNPDKCISCHKMPVRPVWQPYRFWTGQTPFMEDTLVKGSKETEWYMNYLEKIKTKKDRWRWVTPPFTKEQAQKSLDETGRFEIPNQPATAKEFRRTDGSSNDISNQYLEQNACMVANNLKKRPDWDKVKYLISGLLNGCRPPEDFLLPEFQENATNYMKKRGIAIDATGKFSQQLLLQDTQKRHNFATTYKKAAHSWHLHQHMTPAEVENEFNIRERETQMGYGFGFRNFEENTDIVSNIRYGLLPLGINVNEWSMDNDPMNFAHGQVFSSYRSQPIIQEVIAEARREIASTSNGAPVNACDKLKEKSKMALTDLSKYGNLPEGNINCDMVKVNDTAYINDFLNVGKSKLLDDVMKTFTSQGCVYCHDGNGQNKYTGMNTPDMPMSSAKDFEAFIKTKPEMMDSMLDRVTRSTDMPGHMPQYGTGLNTQEVAEMKALFQILKTEGKSK